jgi:tetratricopeptide (TPR) repeat protein
MRIRHPAAFFSKLIMIDKAVAKYAGQSPLHTDDNARLEYSSPRALLRARTTLLLEDLYRFRARPEDLLSVFNGIEDSAQLVQELSHSFQAQKIVVAGFRHYVKGAAQDAVKEFEAALAINPQNYEATELLARLNYEIAGRYKNSRRMAEATAAYENSIRAIDNFLSNDRSLPADYYALELIYARANLNLAVLSLNANRLKGVSRDTIKRFETALAISPNNYDATELLAKLTYESGSQHKKAGRLAEAKAVYEKSIAAIDKFVAADRAKLSNYPALEVIYARAHLDLGIMALNANRLAEAAAALEKSVSGEMRFAEAHNNLGVVYARLSKDEAAAKHYRSAIELNPSMVSARMNYGSLLLRQKKYPEAIASYHRIQELKPDFAITNYNLGMAYFMQDQWKKAEAEWEHALALKPDFDQARQGLKTVRQKMGSQ